MKFYCQNTTHPVASVSPHGVVIDAPNEGSCKAAWIAKFPTNVQPDDVFSVIDASLVHFFTFQATFNLVSVAAPALPADGT
jgi:hypothetical protein